MATKTMTGVLTNLTIAGCLMAALAWPQNGPIFRSDVDVVTVSCAVVDSRGAPVRDLGASDFKIYDNDRRRLIEHMWLDTNSPLVIGVIIDSSASQESNTSEHSQTAFSILREVLRPHDRAFVISAGSEIRMIADVDVAPAELQKRLSENAGKPFGSPCASSLRDAARNVSTPGCGPTRLWDAVYDAARLRLRSAKGSKALLLITDGFDVGSSRTWRQAANEAQKAEASIYAVQYRSGLGGTFPQNLYRLLGDSGGTWFDPPNGRYERIVSRLEADLRGRYVLSFRPDKLSGATRHELRVEAARPELTVRARKAYFWPPE